MLADDCMDAVIAAAASALVNLEDSELEDIEKGRVGFGVSYLVGALALGEDHDPVSNMDVAQGGLALVQAYLDQLEDSDDE